MASSAQHALAPRAGPGRPSTGARERILAACHEVLRESGYAGLSIAKVAARAGEAKALVSYHYGSKNGLVAATAGEIGAEITHEILGGLENAKSVEDIIAGADAGLWRLLQRDERLPRVYFDLNAVSVVDPAVREALRGIKDQWRTVLSSLLRQAEPALSPKAAGTAATLVIAGLEGLTLEHVERGNTPELRRARRMFISATAAAIVAD